MRSQRRSSRSSACAPRLLVTLRLASVEEVAKRRSSTRVGRKHPRVQRVAVIDTRATPRNYLVSQPVIVDNAICRVVRANDTHVEVQEWRDMYWQPSAQPLWRIDKGVPAPPELLETLGIHEPVEVPNRWSAPELRRLTPAEAAELMLRSYQR